MAAWANPAHGKTVPFLEVMVGESGVLLGLAPHSCIPLRGGGEANAASVSVSRRFVGLFTVCV